jgi:ATP-dependent protease HslVU (ClpYQ) peptidase subunit
MTAIVGFVDPETGDVLMGGDSSAVNRSMDMFVVKSPKVFVNGEFLIGYAGEFRWGQLFRYVKLPKCRTTDIEQFMAINFANTLRGAARELGCLQEDHGQEIGGTCLVGLRGRLFMVQETFEAIEAVDGMLSIGVGSSYALGALKASDKPAQERVEQALEVSAHFCGGVRAPFHVVRLKADGKSGRKAATRHSRHSRRNQRDQKRKARPGARRSRANAEMGPREHARRQDLADRYGSPDRKFSDHDLQHPQRTKRTADHVG